MLPCVRSHTLVRSCCCAWQRRDLLAAGACNGRVCCALLWFDASGLRGVVPGAAELRLTLCSIFPPDRDMALRIEAPEGAARIVHACGPGPLCADALGLLAGRAEGLLRIAIHSDGPCGALALIEPYAPAPCIAVTPGAAGCSMRADQQCFDLEFEQSASLPAIDTLLARQCTFYVTNAGDSPFTADLETCAQPPHWVRDVRLSVAAGETRALVAKYYGAFVRVSFSGAEAGRAQVRFVGQYFT